MNKCKQSIYYLFSILPVFAKLRNFNVAFEIPIDHMFPRTSVQWSKSDNHQLCTQFLGTSQSVIKLESFLLDSFWFSGINAIGTLAARCWRRRNAGGTPSRAADAALPSPSTAAFYEPSATTNKIEPTRWGEINAAQEAAAQLAMKTNPSWRSQTQDAVRSSESIDPCSTQNPHPLQSTSKSHPKPSFEFVRKTKTEEKK